MKSLYAFITKANQVLFFLAALTVVGGVGYLVYDETSHTFQPPHIAVAGPSGGEPAPTFVREVRFLRRKGEVYTFGVIKREVSATPTSDVKVRGGFSRGRDADSSGKTVNIVFSKSDGPVRTLLSNDGLVLSSNLAGQYDHEKAHFNVFRCVTEDTDANGVLNANDRQDLYIVRDNLSSPDIVIRSVSDFDITSDDDLVVQTSENGTTRFWQVDVTRGAKKEIRWK